MTLFGIKKIVVQGCCGHLPHCLTCSRYFTFFLRFSCQVYKNLWVKLVTAQTPRNLVTPRCFFQVLFLKPWQPFFQTFLPLTPPRHVLQALHLKVAPMLGHSSLFSSHLLIGFSCSSNSSSTYKPLSTQLVLVEFMQKACSSFTSRSHPWNKLLALFFSSLFLVVRLFLQPVVPFLHCVRPFGVKPCFQTISSQQLTDPPTNCFARPFCLLLFF